MRTPISIFLLLQILFLREPPLTWSGSQPKDQPGSTAASHKRRTRTLEEAIAAIPAAQESLHKSGWLIRAYDPVTEGKGDLLKGVVRPMGWRLQPVILETRAQISESAEANFLIHVPHDLADQAIIAARILVRSADKELAGDVVHSEILYSKKPSQKPHGNAVYRIGVKGPQKDLTIQALCWVMLPLSQAKGSRAESAVKEVATRAQFGILKHASEVAMSIQYDPGASGYDTNIAKTNGWRGDCSQRAAWAAKESKGLLETVTGYCTTDLTIRAAEGRHCCTFGKVRGKGFVLDTQGALIRPQNQEYIVTDLGGLTEIEMPGVGTVSVGNFGAWLGATASPAGISTATAGPNASTLAKLKPPREVQDYFELRRTIRMALYQKGNRESVRQ